MIRRFYRLLKKRGKPFDSENVRITSYSNFKYGSNSFLYNSTYIQNTNGFFEMGNNSHLGAFCYVNVHFGKCILGDDVSIGPGTKLIVYSNHFNKEKKNSEVRICEDIVIGNDVFIGANCVVLPGSVIEDKVVIGAGSVVKGVIKSGGIYAGAICQKIKDL